MNVTGKTEDSEESEVKGSPKDSMGTVNSETQNLRVELERISKELNTQKRDLEVEAGLEKVRSKAMSIQGSEDLRTVVQILYEQLRNLGFQWGVASITIMDPETGDIDWWMEGFGDGYVLPECYHVPFFDHPGHLQQLEHWKSGTPYAEIKISGQDKKTYDAYYFFNTDFVRAPEASKQLMMQQETVLFSMAYMKYGALSWSPSRLSKEQSNILERFAKVFEQCYTRFLDLQKAEDHAKEAQIELALERVRARTMKMQKSDELSEAAVILFNQVKSLGLELWGCGFNIWEKNAKECVSWMSNPDGGLTPPFIIPLTEIPLFIRFNESRQNGVDFYVKEVQGKELEENYQYMSKLPVLGEGLMAFLNSGGQIPTFQVDHVVNFSHGNLIFITYQPYPKAHSIFKRFGKVFEQTYTRFLDLQKAEAQAREAQIEAALEKIRSRSLAMHHSGELREVITVFFEKLNELGVLLGTVGIALFDQKSNHVSYWIGTSLQDPQLVGAPFNQSMMETENFLSDCWSAMKEKRVLLNKVYNKDQKDLYFEYMFSNNDLIQIPSTARDVLRKMEIHTVCFFPNNHSSLFVDSWDGRQYSEESISILKRTGKVFEQAYTRFLDLQKAEAQAREAQIEAALERVRSRTMAMHRSEELTEVASMLFRQIKDLGIRAWTTGFNVWADDNNSYVDYVTNPEGNFIEPYKVDTTLAPVLKGVREARNAGQEFLVNYEEGEAIKETYRFLMSFGEKGQYEKLLASGFQFPTQQYEHFVFGKKVSLMFITYEPVPEAHDIFKRFGKVFEQTYTRFLDLQKAESQARESQIEAALERVRSQSMAMHKSEDLLKVITVVSEQLQHLNFIFNTVSFAINSQKDDYSFWFAIQGDPTPIYIQVPYIVSPMFDRIKDVLASGIDFYADTLTPEENRKWHEHVFTHAIWPSLTEDTKAYILRSGYAMSVAIKPSIMLIVSNYAGKPYSDSENEIIKRFGTVFEQSYTRFLDLQKAESQAREARIEAALERVRSASLAMHHSDELEKVVLAVSERLTELGFQFNGTLIFIFDSGKRNITLWIASTQLSTPVKVQLPNDPEVEDNAIWKTLWNAIDGGDQVLNKTFTGKIKDDYFRYVQKHNPETIPAPVKQLELEIPNWSISIAAEKNSILAVDSWSGKEITLDEFHILTRFARVFEQAYVRFLDLQKAEAQAREAQIEVALERVRAKAMAMHVSQELNEVVHELRNQLGILGQKELDTCVIHLHDESPDFIYAWAAMRPPESTGEILDSTAHVPKKGLMIIEEALHAYSMNLQDYVLVNEGEKIMQWIEFLQKEVPEAHTKMVESAKGVRLEDVKSFWSFADFAGGSLLMVTVDQPEETSRSLLRRFANVFGLAYRRFADLKQAEAQARESQIQLALERVRARTMAMQHSDELAEAAFVLFQQLQALGIVHERINIGIVKEENNTIDFWITEQGGNQINTRFSGKIDEPTTLSKMYAGWKKNQKSMVIDQTGDNLEKWLRYLKEDIGIPFDPAFLHHRRVQSVGFFSKGMLVVTTPEPLPQENLGLLVKFAGVFDLTYTRFSDLKQAEAQAREAKIEVALERIRTRALAMQSSTELSDVANVLREQMGILGQEDLEASVVHLYSADSPTFDSWYAFRAGDKIIEGQITFHLENSALAKEFLRLYLDEITEYTIEAKGEQLKEWLAEIKRNAPTIAAYWGDLPPEKQFYHFSDFSGGALLMVSHQNLSEETRMLQKRCALVFELAYKRFLDLEAKERQDQELREEKQRLEKALSELKATQSQLIQSEKMASLGQLTAGIAHEIKNPLNFVNNFSEVSIELIGEIQEERDKNQDARDETLIGEILEDIKSNLLKVHEHGTRADGIVKSMLQHSRSSGNKIESKAFNPIVKEFANLAFHGMRAGKAPINVEIDLLLDPEVGEVKLISDDFSRVILNLCNNAFDAMRDKLQEASESPTDFLPKLTLSTQKTSDQEIQLVIGDNGKGIPEEILDKILEPFFTTKKGTEGTGLGLSISYDIIKAHGGKLEVRSKVGIGTEFIIHIPIS